MLTVTDVMLDIHRRSEAISIELAAHPIAGQHFLSLPSGSREAWVAWTWLFHQLTDRGLTRRAALNIRDAYIERAQRLGTYGAIAACINAQDADDSPVKEDDELDLLDEMKLMG